MVIADNILQHHLSHVYWVSGTCCGGKSTMTARLAAKHGMTTYYTDDLFQQHKAIATPAKQPAMLRHFIDFEWFFNRPVPEYSRWLMDAAAEEMGMVVADLLRAPNDKPIVVDTHCCPDLLRRIAAPNHVVFLVAQPERCRREYFNREDKQDMYRCIQRMSDPARTLNNVLDTIEHVARQEYESALAGGLPCLTRDDGTVLEHRLRLVEEIFKLAH